MKLSEEATAYAESIYRKAFTQCAIDGEEERRQIRANTAPANPNTAPMANDFVNLTKRLIDAKVQSYVQAFEQDGLLIDEEDKDEVIKELKHILRNNTIWVTTDCTLREFRLPGNTELIPNIESYMTARFERILGEAVVDLDLARKKMVMDRKNRKTELSSTHYRIHVHGDNLGNIQQGCHDNSQFFNRSSENGNENK